MRGLTAAELPLDLDIEGPGEAGFDIAVGNVDGLRRTEVFECDIEQRTVALQRRW